MRNIGWLFAALWFGAIYHLGAGEVMSFALGAVLEFAVMCVIAALIFIYTCWLWIPLYLLGLPGWAISICCLGLAYIVM